MSASALPRMSADDFIDWSMRQQDGQRYELVAGEVFAMAPQRSGNSLLATRIATRLSNAVEAQGLPCFVHGDGMAVEIDETTVFEPDVLVRCGPALPYDALMVTDPIIVVEVQSPSSATRDAVAKFAGYFRLPSLRHYLIVAGHLRTVIHHQRDESGVILSRIVRDGAITLDPPGIALRDLFA